MYYGMMLIKSMSLFFDINLLNELYIVVSQIKWTKQTNNKKFGDVQIVSGEIVQNKLWFSGKIG